MNPLKRIPKSRISLLSVSFLLAGPLLAASDYTLVWADEFNYTGLPDPAYWNYDVGGGGWGNGEFQYYTEERLENTRVEGGNLIIEARKENWEVDGFTNAYTSGRLLTKGKWDWTYGRFEARIKVPAGGSGLWPAFWMLGSDIDTVGWPKCGEIDIMEYVSRIPNEIFGTIHGPGYNAGGSYGNIYDFGEPVPEAFHVYAIEWKPELISWYVDGVLYHTATPEDIVGTGRVPNKWVFDKPHFILLNLAIGGTFGGIIDPDIPFPVQYLVDYVRVYKTNYGVFNGYEVINGWANTGDFMGWVQLDNYPWVYVDSLDSYAFAAPSDSSDGWIFLPR